MKTSPLLTQLRELHYLVTDEDSRSLVSIWVMFSFTKLKKFSKSSVKLFLLLRHAYCGSNLVKDQVHSVQNKERISFYFGHFGTTFVEVRGRLSKRLVLYFYVDFFLRMFVQKLYKVYERVDISPVITIDITNPFSKKKY